MDDIRASFRDCCFYPRLKFSDYEEKCKNICEGNKELGCCQVTCYYDQLGLLTKNEAGNAIPDGINIKGMIEAFMAYVGNDPRWEPFVNDAVVRCNLQIQGSDDRYECGIIPRNYEDVMECAYVQNYLNCPEWNPRNIENCSYTREFVEKCPSF